MKAKPAKPFPDFPLTAHSNGQWCKKIKGKIRFFGVWRDPMAALKLFLDEREDLYAGRTPSRRAAPAATTEAVVGSFLNRSKMRAKMGEISGFSLGDYLYIGRLILGHFGKKTDPTLLKPADFLAFKASLFNRYGPSRIAKTIVVTRMVFNWAFASELIASMPRFGPDFKVPTRRQMRMQKAKKGKMLVEQAEAKALVSLRDPMWRAICLLGLNCGFGNSDVADLRTTEVLGDWIEKPRNKTGVERRIPLWPETVAALAEWMRVRPKPASGNDDLVFVSVRGRKLIRVNVETGIKADRTGEGFKKALRAAAITREGIGFYWLRHTFQTIGDGARDSVATSAIMGHVDSSMAGHYREGINDERLIAVTEHVRNWTIGSHGET